MMNEVLHANIFFLIASIATVAFAILVCVAIYHVIKILVAVRTIVERIAAVSDMIAEDIGAMRDFVTSGSLVTYIIGLVSGKRRGRTRSKVHEDAHE